MKCTICDKEIAKGESVFPFPKLPETHKYSFLHGMNHVRCIRDHEKVEDIGKELANICSDIFNQSSEYPVVINNDRILIQNREPDECVLIYNFKDFVQFHIPYSQIEHVKNLKVGSKLPLGISKLISLEVLEDSCLFLEQRTPFTRTDMPSLKLDELKLLLEKLPN